jgi:hypothetical protein
MMEKMKCELIIIALPTSLAFFFSVRLAGWLSDPLLLSFARGRFVA